MFISNARSSFRQKAPTFAPMITLAQLEYLVALDTHRNFSAAAESCHITQPTLSMQLRKLEEQLEVSLFDRSRQPVVPTAVGENVVAQARQVLREAEKLQEVVQQYHQQQKGQLRIGIIPTLAPYLLPLIAGSFTRQYPDLKLVIHEGLTHELLELLEKDQLDGLLLVTPIEQLNHTIRPLFYEQLMCFVHPLHPLSLTATVEAEELSAVGLWLLGQGHCFRSQTLNLCGLKNEPQHEQPISYQSGSLSTIMKLVEVEGGYTIVPELATTDLSKQQQEMLRKFNDPQPLREVSLVHLRTASRTRLLRLLASHIQEKVPQELLNKERGKVVEWE